MQIFVRRGDILGDLFLPEPKAANGIGIVWCPGLPNNPVAEDMGAPLAAEGFTVLQARYPGSWQSYGTFGPRSSLAGAITGLELLAGGTAQDLGSLSQVTWSLNRLALVGNSYGGAVAVCALACSALADAAVAFCPFLDPPAQNADPAQTEEDVSGLYDYLQRCHANVFRGMDWVEWQDFLQGRSVLYPPAYRDRLGNRPLLLVHGETDETIRAYHTTAFHQSLLDQGAGKPEIILVEGVGHGRALRAAAWGHWTQWLHGIEVP